MRASMIRYFRTPTISHNDNGEKILNFDLKEFKNPKTRNQHSRNYRHKSKVNRNLRQVS